jgi:hypothetical protein
LSFGTVGTGDGVGDDDDNSASVEFGSSSILSGMTLF